MNKDRFKAFFFFCGRACLCPFVCSARFLFEIAHGDQDNEDGDNCNDHDEKESIVDCEHIGLLLQYVVNRYECSSHSIFGVIALCHKVGGQSLRKTAGGTIDGDLLSQVYIMDLGLR